MTLLDELTWRGMVQDVTAGAAKVLDEKKVVVYAGFDPTAASLQIGNLVPIMLLLHFQRAGHRPIALVGGATGMVGDPSGKSEERVLQSLDSIHDNVGRFKVQLRKFLNFDSGETAAEMVDNYDWFRNFSLLDFLRDAGKHLTVNYMLAKDSVQQRLENGLSFTEFSYQLLQAYDFYRLYTDRNCTFQVGGSDQWGNITAGTELVRRIAGGEAHALTCPLLTKADGTKFGKTAAGERLWLDPTMTSPYKFFQFWLNASDTDAGRFIRVFSLLSREEVEGLEQEQKTAPHLRPLQNALARDITVRVHSEHDYRRAVEASEILFGNGTAESLRGLTEQELLSVLEGVPQSSVPLAEFEQKPDFLTFLTGKAGVFPSKGEARRMVTSGGVFLNKTKVTDPTFQMGLDALINGKYILVQKGKKNYHLVRVE